MHHSRSFKFPAGRFVRPGQGMWQTESWVQNWPWVRVAESGAWQLIVDLESSKCQLMALKIPSCVCTLRFDLSLAANIFAVQKEGVHLKGSLVLVWGLGQGKGEVFICKESFYATSPLQTVFANCSIGVCFFYWFCMEKRKKQHLANDMLWNANNMGSKTCTVWRERVNQCWELQAFPDWCALTRCENLEAFHLIVVLSSVCLCSLSVIIFLKKVLLNA